MVLARGLGTRMRQADAGIDLTREQQQAADAGLKPLMPINGHPFLAFVLSAIAEADIREVAIVVAPDHEPVRRYLAESPPRRLDVSLIVQAEARGTADAVLAVRGWVSGDPFLVMNADNVYPSAALRDLATLEEPGFPAFDAENLVATSNIPAERVRAFAVVEIDADGYLTSIIEKPAHVPPKGGNYPAHVGPEGGNRPAQLGPEGGTPPGHLGPEGGRSPSLSVVSAFRRKVGATTAISMNLWRFDERIFEACRDVPRSARGEFELPEAVGLAVSRGMRIKAVPARGPVLDLSRRADAADVSRRLAGITPCP